MHVGMCTRVCVCVCVCVHACVHACVHDQIPSIFSLCNFQFHVYTHEYVMCTEAPLSSVTYCVFMELFSNASSEFNLFAPSGEQQLSWGRLQTAQR